MIKMHGGRCRKSFLLSRAISCRILYPLRSIDRILDTCCMRDGRLSLTNRARKGKMNTIKTTRLDGIKVDHLSRIHVVVFLSHCFDQMRNSLMCLTVLPGVKSFPYRRGPSTTVTGKAEKNKVGIQTVASLSRPSCLSATAPTLIRVTGIAMWRAGENRETGWLSTGRKT